MLLLPTTAPASPTAWRGKELFCLFFFFFSFSVYVPGRDYTINSLHSWNAVLVKRIPPF